MTKKLIIVDIVVLLLFCLKAIAQQPDFLFEYPMPEELQSTYVVTSAIEIDSEEGYLLAVCTSEANSWFVNTIYECAPAKVFKVSPMGELEAELLVGINGAPSIIDGLFNAPNDPDFFLVAGRIRDLEQEYDRFFITKFDRDLNLLWQQEIELPEEYHTLMGGARVFMDSQGDILYCVAPFEADPNGGIPMPGFTYKLYIRLTTDGTLGAVRQYPKPSSLVYAGQGELFEFQDGSGDYGHVSEDYEWEGGNPSPYLIRTDRDFTDFTRTSLPQSISFPLENHTIYYEKASARTFSDGTMVIAAEDGYGWWDSINYGFESVIAAMEFDWGGSLLGLSCTAYEGDVNYDEESLRKLAFNRAMDGDEAKLYFCYGLYDKNYGAWGLSNPNGFVVVRTDVEANILWQRYCQYAERLFHPYAVTVTSDEGCIVAGGCFGKNYEHPRIFAMKIFSDGSLSLPEAEAIIRPYLFYPNPVQDELHLQYSPDVTPTQIELYDLQGRLVRTQKNGLERLEMNGLPAGTYTMRVTLEGGKVFSDTIIKE